MRRARVDVRGAEARPGVLEPRCAVAVTADFHEVVRARLAAVLTQEERKGIDVQVVRARLAAVLTQEERNGIAVHIDCAMPSADLLLIPWGHCSGPADLSSPYKICRCCDGILGTMDW